MSFELDKLISKLKIDELKLSMKLAISVNFETIDLETFIDKIVAEDTITKSEAIFLMYWYLNQNGVECV